MTTTKTCCDGCGKERAQITPIVGGVRYESGWVLVESLYRSDGQDWERAFCPDCWKKMREAIASSGEE